MEANIKCPPSAALMFSNQDLLTTRLSLIYHFLKVLLVLLEGDSVGKWTSVTGIGGSSCKFKKGVHTPWMLGVSVSTGRVILVILRPLRLAKVWQTCCTSCQDSKFLTEIWCCTWSGDVKYSPATYGWFASVDDVRPNRRVDHWI